MLDVRDIGFARRERAILSEIAFGVGPGRMLVILGPNGAGKTTLLKCLNGLLAPRRGAVLIEGEDLRRLSTRAVAARMGYVAQRTETARLTVFDAVLMGRKPRGASRSLGEVRVEVPAPEIRSAQLRGSGGAEISRSIMPPPQRWPSAQAPGVTPWELGPLALARWVPLA